MNDDHPAFLEALKAEHRELDERIQLLSSEPTGDQLELDGEAHKENSD